MLFIPVLSLCAIYFLLFWMLHALSHLLFYYIIYDIILNQEIPQSRFVEKTIANKLKSIYSCTICDHNTSLNYCMVDSPKRFGYVSMPRKSNLQQR